MNEDCLSKYTAQSGAVKVNKQEDTKERGERTKKR